MHDTTDSGHWITRLITALIIGGLAFGGLYFWETDSMGLGLKAGIAAGVAAVVFLLGGSLLSWLNISDYFD
ncbi:MAG: hypothetical protein ACLFUS_01425 [Candidatus Sumerlaeia bacterium]